MKSIIFIAIFFISAKTGEWLGMNYQQFITIFLMGQIAQFSVMFFPLEEK